MLAINALSVFLIFNKRRIVATPQAFTKLTAMIIGIIINASI